MVDVKISQLSKVSSSANTDLFEVSRESGGSYVSNSITYENLCNSIQGTTVIHVDASSSSDGNASLTIEDGIARASALSPSVSNPITVLVHPGSYTENPLTVPSYVSLYSVGGPSHTFVTASDVDSSVITLSVFSSVVGLGIIGASGSNGVGIEAGTMVLDSSIKDCTVRNCTVGYLSSGPLSVVRMYDSSYLATVACEAALKIESGGTIFAFNNGILSSGAGSVDYGVSVSGSGSKAVLLNGRLDRCDTGFFIDDGGFLESSSYYIVENDTAVHIGSTGSNSKATMYGCSIQDSTVYDFKMDSVTSVIEFTGAYGSYKRSIVNGAELRSIAQDSSTEGTTITGDTRVENRFDVGIPAKDALGLEIGVDIGTGRGYRVDRLGNEAVEYWTYDASAPSGSRFARMVNNAGTQLSDDGDALVVGGRYDYSALELDILQAANLGSTSIVTEHWDGTQWVEHYTCAYSRADFTHRQNNFLQNVETQYVEHGRDVYDNWVSAEDVTDEIPAWDLGSDMYAVRFRNNGGSLVTSAIINDGKVKADNFSVQVSGEAASWGQNRIADVIAIDASQWDFDAINPPARVSIEISSNISLTEHPSFLNNADCKASVFTTVPTWADTSTPLVIKGGLVSPTTVASGDVVFTVTIVALEQGEILGTLLEDTYVFTNTLSGTANELQILSEEINIQEIPPSSTLILGIERDATASNPLDTFDGDVVFLSIEMNYYKKIIG